jgi:GGDEF domain-containing protein
VFLELIFCVLVLIAALFAVPIYLTRNHVFGSDETVLAAYDQIARQKSALLGEYVVSAGALSLHLATQASELYASERYEPNKKLYRDKGFTVNGEEGQPFSFWSTVRVINEVRQRANKLITLLPLMESMFSNSSNYASAFIYLDDPMAIELPLKESIEVLDKNFSLFDDPLYNTFVKNPRRQWRVIVDDHIRVGAPVFAGGDLIGYAGFEIDGGVFKGLVKDDSLPDGSVIVIINNDNQSVVASNLPNGTDYKIYTDNSDGRFLSAKSDVDVLPFSVIFAAPDNTKEQKDALFMLLLKFAAAVSCLALTLFWLIAANGISGVRSFSKMLTRSIDTVVRFSYHLGSKRAERLSATGIVEIDDLINHIHLAHSKIAQQLMIDDTLQIGTRRKLMEDLELKGPFSVVVFGIQHKAKEDLFYASEDYIVSRTSELVGALLEDDDELYYLGMNRFALLLNTDNRAVVDEFAAKVAQAVEKGSYIFNSVALHIAIRVGIGSEPALHGAKLLLSAEADLIRARGQ